MRRTSIVVAALACAATALVAPTAGVQPPTKPTPPRQVTFDAWRSGDFRAGTSAGAAMSADGDLVIGSAVGTTSYDDPFDEGGAQTFEHATWTSPTVAPGFNLTE